MQKLFLIFLISLSCVLGNAQDEHCSEIIKKIPLSESWQEYNIEKGDFLLGISIKLYGTPCLWKSLQKENAIQTSELSSSMVGQKIRFRAPLEKLSWPAAGRPHVIKNGDSLVGLAKSFYGNANKWKCLFYNNSSSIKKEDEIYAGMVLYFTHPSFCQD